MKNTTKRIEAPTAEDYAQAKQVAEWMESLIDSGEAEASDYIYNLSIYAKAGFVNEKGYGLVASAPAARNRELAASIKRVSTSQHVGKVGERLTLQLKLVSLSTKDGQFGVTHIQKFMDPNGNLFTWFGSTCLFNLEGDRQDIGESCWVKGTVKAHNEFRGEKETILTRCEVTLSPDAAKASKAAAAKASREAKKARDAARKAFGESKVVATYGFAGRPDLNQPAKVWARIVQLSDLEFVREMHTNGVWDGIDPRDNVYSTLEECGRVAMGPSWDRLS